MPLVTFVIPVRHQDNARDWERLKNNLSETIASISAQTHSDWRGVIVANEGADLPALPDKFRIERVDFPPNVLHDRGSASEADFHDAFRLDKGRRVLKGMLRSAESRFFMICDDDDFVSARLVQFVAQNPDANGWRIDQGYIWNDGGKLLFKHNDFNRICGTSLIIRADLYRLPTSIEAAAPEWMKAMLGSHVRIGAALAEYGTPLASLPFRGAIYRVGHAGSHSQVSNFLSRYLFDRGILTRPKLFFRNAGQLVWIGPGLRREFFGQHSVVTPTTAVPWQRS